MHQVLYVIANTSSMNGAMPGSVFTEGLRMTQKLVIGANIIFCLLILILVCVIFRGFKPSRHKLDKQG